MSKTLFTKDALRTLTANGKATRKADEAGRGDPDHFPVVKIYNPYGHRGTWLFTELDADGDTLFGLCEEFVPECGITNTRPALREISLKSLLAVAPHTDLERDRNFHPFYPLTVWLEAAQRAGRITEDDDALAQAAAKLNRSQILSAKRREQQQEELRQ